MFSYENNLVYPVDISDQKFKDCMNLLLITDISRIISISKISRDLCAIRQKIKTKNTFADIVYNALVVKISCKNIKSLFENKW